MKKSSKVPCVVTIAGTDPSGGAGIQADIKAISATGSYAASIITALVAQNTQGVQAIQEVSTDFVQKQMESVFGDLDIQAVKVGMLHNERMVDTVFSELRKINHSQLVFDPVMVAKCGSTLLELDTIEFLKSRLAGVASLITPNIFEAEHLIGAAIKTLSDMETAAIQLGNRFQVNVLLKGGHLNGKQSSDVLYIRQQEQCRWFHAMRIDTRNTHGTGCSLSSAIASYLAQGFPLYEAVHAAKQWLTMAIQSGATQQIGKGHGPVDHFYFLENRKHMEPSV